MKKNLTWKKQFFSSTCLLYSDGQIVGMLKDKPFSQSAIGKLNGKEYAFKTKGLFKQNTEIIDSKENKVIGTIAYSNWMTKATISLTDKLINWKYDNLWNTKWRIFDNEGIEIKYTGSSTSGRIESNADDAVLLLSGLFVPNYFWQMSVAVLVVILIPIWATVLN